VGWDNWRDRVKAYSSIASSSSPKSMFSTLVLSAISVAKDSVGGGGG
jgi:hypothetical protein